MLSLEFVLALADDNYVPKVNSILQKLIMDT
jgi:hypothetical protein